MWTRLVAGAAAHEINNLAQGLFNLLTLATSPTAPPDTLERYSGLARDGIQDLRQLGMDLRALASTLGGDDVQRLDSLATEAIAEAGAPRDRSVDLGPLETGALVRGPASAIRLGIKSVVRYAASASAPAGRVSVSVSLDGKTAAVVVTAPSAPTPHAPVETELGAVLSGETRDFGGDAGLVLAGAAVHLWQGQILAGPAPGGGLRFTLTFPVAA